MAMLRMPSITINASGYGSRRGGQDDGVSGASSSTSAGLLRRPPGNNPASPWLSYSPPQPGVRPNSLANSDTSRILTAILQSGTCVPKPSLPMRLALLVAGTALPLIVFAAVIVFENYQQDRQDASQRVLETVRSIRLVLDAEVQRMTGGLQVLALTGALRNGDFAAFRPIVSGFLEQYGADSVVLVSDRDGRQLFSSVTTDAASLPARNNRDIVQQVFATASPHYSNLFIGAVKNTPIVTVEVPVVRDGKVIYDISFSPPIGIFQTILEKQRPSADWTISILDAASVNFARVPNPQENVGRRASPSLYAEMARKSEATLAARSLEGTPLITSFARSSLTGWTVAAGIAES